MLGLANIEVVGEQNYKTLDKLYRSGEFDSNESMLDSEKHMASSVEGLIETIHKRKATGEVTNIFHSTNIQSLQRLVVIQKEFLE